MLDRTSCKAWPKPGGLRFLDKLARATAPAGAGSYTGPVYLELLLRPFSGLLALAALVGLAVTAGPAAAKAIDCTSPKLSAVDQKVCGSPRLLTLDAELDSAYRKAQAATEKPQRVKDLQASWLLRRTALAWQDDDLDLEALFRQQIELLQALAEKPAASIAPLLDARLGRYGRWTQEFVFEGGDWKSGGKRLSSLLLLPRADGQIDLTIRSSFANGHTCGFDGLVRWREEKLVTEQPANDRKSEQCSLTLEFTANSVTVRAKGDACAVVCGARGTLNDEFSKIGP